MFFRAIFLIVLGSAPALIGSVEPPVTGSAISLSAEGDRRAGFPRPMTLVQADEQRLVFSALGRDWVLELASHSPLTSRARAALSSRPLPTFYRGQLAGDSRSWVRLARSRGEYTGHVYTDGALYRIDPVTASKSLGAYRLTAIGERAPLAPRYQQRVTAPMPGVTRAMNVGIVVDSRFNDFHDGRGLERALSIMNGVDGLFREQLGLAVEVDKVRVLDDPLTDPMRDQTGTLESVLTAFREVRLDDAGLPNELALVHLFSGVDPVDDVVGLGLIDTVCRLDGFDVSMSTPFSFETLLSAHEISHNLGALHDENTACLASNTGAASNRLMEARLSSSTSSEFSQCSIDRLQSTLQRDCLIDALDLSVDAEVTERRDGETWRVNVRVSNHDTLRAAQGVRSRSRLPSGTRIEAPGAGCAVFDEIIVCEHGDVAALSSRTISLIARLDNVVGAEVVTVLEPGAYLDLHPLNDRVTRRFGVAEDDPPNAPAMRDPVVDDESAPAFTDAGRQPGSVTGGDTGGDTGSSEGGSTGSSTGGGTSGGEDSEVDLTPRPFIGSLSMPAVVVLLAVAGTGRRIRRRDYKSRSTE